MRLIFSLPTWVNPQVYLRISAGRPADLIFFVSAQSYHAAGLESLSLGA
jgi:hypothetical protein